MRHLLFLFLFNQCVLLNAFGQACLSQIDSIFHASDTSHFAQQITTLEDSCKYGWYHYYLGLSYFFQNEIDAFEIEVLNLFNSMERDYASGWDLYLLRAKSALLSLMLLEEYRRTKNKTKFKAWQQYYNRIKLVGCGTTQRQRMLFMLIYMQIRFDRNGQYELAAYYEDLDHGRKFNRFSRRLYRQISE